MTTPLGRYPEYADQGVESAKIADRKTPISRSKYRTSTHVLIHVGYHPIPKTA